MTVPGRTSHKPLSFKPSSLVQNKQRAHYLLFQNFMWGRKEKKRKEKKRKEKKKQHKRKRRPSYTL